MKFTILTLFPDMFQSIFSYSILKRARETNIIEVNFINIRDFSTDAYKSVDDHPYGGGHGMILRVDIVDAALSSIPSDNQKQIRVLLDPRGIPYTQHQAQTFTTYDHVIIVCGHYEGIDERIRSLVDMQISIGDYVVTGGEIPSMMIMDSVTRVLPGVLSYPESSHDESFTSNLLEYPQYTKPQLYKGTSVPEVLLSGNHKLIKEWKQQQSERITKTNRPDLLTKKTP